MNSPPEALSPSPSTPSSGSPSQEDISLPPSISAVGSSAQALHTLVSASPSQQAKRRLPSSSSSVFAGREGRENKSRRRERDRTDDRDVRDERSRKGGAAWEPVRGDMQGHGHAGPTARLREELVDLPMVEYARATYGDPFDDTILKERNRA